MRTWIIISCWIMWTGCRPEENPQAPVLTHFDSVLYGGRNDSIVVLIKGAAKDWSFFLLSQRQPIVLPAMIRNNKCVIPLRFDRDLYAGPAAFCCMKGNNRWFFPLRLREDSNAGENMIRKDYRSPKTVNPDSGLWQQRIYYEMDISRNILPRQWERKHVNNPYFFCDTVRLPPRVGTYMVQPHVNLTAVYVQPGTIDRLSIRGYYDRKTGQVVLHADHLKDVYGNIAADGTMVRFIYWSAEDRRSPHTVETAIFHGAATAIIPAGIGKMEACARVAGINSGTIQITVTK